MELVRTNSSDLRTISSRCFVTPDFSSPVLFSSPRGPPTLRDPPPPGPWGTTTAVKDGTAGRSLDYDTTPPFTRGLPLFPIHRLVLTFTRVARMDLQVACMGPR